MENYNVENWTVNQVKLWLYDYDSLPEDLQSMGYNPFKIN
jgi:hypothetical protein